jgi:hypothetical protein
MDTIEVNGAQLSALALGPANGAGDAPAVVMLVFTDRVSAGG